MSTVAEKVTGLVEELERELAQTQESVGALESERDSLQDQVDDLNDRVAELERELAERDMVDRGLAEKTAVAS